MAKRAAAEKSDRSDPKKNKSLAIRNILGRMPNGKAAEIAEAVKKEYGHDVPQNMIYMVKTKTNMASGRRGGRRAGRPSGDGAATAKNNMTTSAQWVEAIKLARQLLRAAGSVETATAVLKAIDPEGR